MAFRISALLTRAKKKSFPGAARKAFLEAAVAWKFPIKQNSSFPSSSDFF
jgi:hypothetical protein